MSNAAAGLRLSTSKPAIALADMKADDILAGLSDEQKAGLAASLTPKAPEGADAGASGGAPKGDAKAGTKAEEPAPEPKADVNEHEGSPAYAAGFAAAVSRTKAVSASEHTAGREGSALKLLGNDKLSADEITGMLADMPKGEGGANADMLANISRNNPDLGNESEDESAGQKANHGWDDIHAEVEASRQITA